MPKTIETPYRTIDAPPELVQQLIPLGEDGRYPRGTLLFSEGEPANGLYIVLEGQIALTMHAGKDGTVRVRTSGRGSLVGLPGTFLRGTYGLTATIEKDARLVFIERQKLLEFLRQHTDACMLVLKVLGTEVSQIPMVPRKPNRRRKRVRGALED